MYNKFANFVAKNRKKILGIVIIFNLLSIFSLFFLKLNTDFKLFMPDKSPSKKIYDEVRKYFKDEGQSIIVINTKQSKIDKNLIKELVNVQEFLQNNSKASEVNGATTILENESNPIFNKNNIDKINISLYEKFIQFMGDLSPLKKYNNDYYAIFTLIPQINRKIDYKIIEKYFKDKNLTFHITGDDYLQYKLIDYIIRIILTIPPFAIILIFLVFSIQIGAKKATLLSVLPAGIAALWTLGLLTLMYRELSIITLLAPIFTIVIGSADGLHYMSHYLDRIEEGKTPVDSVSSTLKMVGIPMILTTVTSAAGFLSLLVFKTKSITQLAISASIGIILAGFATWTILPSITTNDLKINRKKKKNFYINFIKKLSGAPIIIIAIILFVGFLPGIKFIKTDFNELSLFKKSTEPYKGLEIIQKVNNGAMPFEILIKTDKDIYSMNIAKKVFKMEQDLKNKELITKSISIYNIISLYNSLGGISFLLNPEKTLDNIISKNSKFNYESNYPTLPFQITFIKNFIKKSFSEKQLNSLVNEEQNVARIFIFPKNFNNESLSEIKDLVSNYRTKEFQSYVTSIQYLMKDLNDNIKTNQLKSVILITLFIFIILLIYFKKFLPAFLSTIPVLMSVIAVFGFMGYASIPLSIITSIMMGITIGVGIDYAIHFTSVYMHYKNSGETSEIASNNAFDYTSTPIVANALGLAIGLTAMSLSPFIIHVYLTEIMWIGMTTSSIFTLGFLSFIFKKLK